MMSKSVSVIKIIPDRNWNITDLIAKREKLQNLFHVVQLANEMNLPVIVGTEMNSFGQKLVDDFDAPELAPVRDTFLDGAYFLYGHTFLERCWGLGYQSEWALDHFSDRLLKNEFYRRIGRLISPNIAASKNIGPLPSNQKPDEILKIFENG